MRRAARAKPAARAIAAPATLKIFEDDEQRFALTDRVHARADRFKEPPLRRFAIARFGRRGVGKQAVHLRKNARQRGDPWRAEFRTREPRHPGAQGNEHAPDTASLPASTCSRSARGRLRRGRSSRARLPAATCRCRLRRRRTQSSRFHAPRDPKRREAARFPRATRKPSGASVSFGCSHSSSLSAGVSRRYGIGPNRVAQCARFRHRLRAELFF